MSISNHFTPVDDFDFQLPKALIAQQPTRHREDARLMVVDRGNRSIEHSHVRALDNWLHPGDCLVVNETKVLLAKLVGVRSKTGGRWQGLFLESDRAGIWRVMCKTRGNIQPGEYVTLQDRNGLDDQQLVMLARLGGGCWAVRPEPPVEPGQLMSRLGRVPLPHYVRDGNMVDADVENYQTVFAEHPGSIAAPTAGLHFTQALLNRIRDRGITICRVTLHVGLGTFRPISTPTIEEHQMHEERGQIDDETAKQIADCRRAGGRVVAVGTTSVRLLETAAAPGELRGWQGETNLFIYPPYQFQIVDALMTNFHLPRTTLLVLAQTFGGRDLIQTAYREAIDQEYRFFSYGDAMLIV